MAKQTPYIFSEDARAQAAFYIEALGGEVISVMTYGQLPNTDEKVKDKVVHLSLVAGGVPLFICDTFEPVHYGNGISLSLEFQSEAEAREAFGKLTEGGKVKFELQPAFWGALFGQLEDRFGVQWMVTTEVKPN